MALPFSFATASQYLFLLAAFWQVYWYHHHPEKNCNPVVEWREENARDKIVKCHGGGGDAMSTMIISFFSEYIFSSHVVCGFTNFNIFVFGLNRYKKYTCIIYNMKQVGGDLFIFWSNAKKVTKRLHACCKVKYVNRW